MSKLILIFISIITLFSCKKSPQIISKENIIDSLFSKFSNVKNVSYTTRFVYAEKTDTTIQYEYHEKYEDSTGYWLNFNTAAYRFDKLFYQTVFNAAENKAYYRSVDKTEITDYNNPPKYIPGLETISLSILTYVQYLKQTIKLYPNRVKIKDTIINSKELYMIEFSNPDGIPLENKPLDLLNDTIYPLSLIVDKSTSLPEYQKWGLMIIKVSDINLNSNEHDRIWNKTNIPQDFLDKVANYQDGQENFILKVGTNIPNWKLKTIDGNNFDLLELKKKQLIVFFSINCRGCIAEIPVLNRISETTNTLVTAVYFGNKISELKDFITKHNIKYKILINADSKLTLQIKGFPVNYLIDGNGKIIYSELGNLPDLEEKIKMN